MLPKYWIAIMINTDLYRHICRTCCKQKCCSYWCYDVNQPVIPTPLFTSPKTCHLSPNQISVLLQDSVSYPCWLIKMVMMNESRPMTSRFYMLHYFQLNKNLVKLCFLQPFKQDDLFSLYKINFVKRSFWVWLVLNGSMLF